MIFAENAIQLRNPLSEDHVALRPSLLSGLLNVLDLNVRAGAQRIALFELGRVFVPPASQEERRLGILLCGNLLSAPHYRVTEQGPKGSLEFADLKGAIESSFTRREFSFRRSRHPNLAVAAEIYNGNNLIGLAGQLSTALTSKIDAPSKVFLAELSVDLPTRTLGSTATFREFGRFPAIVRDIAMLVPNDLTHETIMETIWPDSPPFLERVEFFDRVVGKEAEELFGPGKKSVAYRLTYRDKIRTLTNEEVTEVHARIREKLKRELGVTLRE